jgi:TRAP-type C4-dicarboxylate transport system substrate-binding protein
MAVRIPVVALALAAVVAVPLASAPRAALTIKLATQALTGTMWEKQLGEMGAAWAKATDGRVTLLNYPDGKAGEERSVITKMRAGTLQASLLTAGGLSFIDQAFNAFTVPFFFDTDEEEMAVQKKLEPALEELLQKRGFHLLCWGTGGWVQVFSKMPINSLDGLKKARLYVNKEDVEMLQWYNRNGFNAKPLALGDIATQLKLSNGMIDTTPMTPYLALMTQVFGSANNMLDAHIAPLVAAVVVTTSAWNQISAEDRDKLTTAARAMETRIRAQAPAQDAASITAMTSRGLATTRPDAKTMAEFRAAAASLAATMRGGIVPADIYDLAAQERDAARRKK